MTRDADTAPESTTAALENARLLLRDEALLGTSYRDGDGNRIDPLTIEGAVPGHSRHLFEKISQPRGVFGELWPGHFTHGPLIGAGVVIDRPIAWVILGLCAVVCIATSLFLGRPALLARLLHVERVLGREYRRDWLAADNGMGC